MMQQLFRKNPFTVKVSQCLLVLLLSLIGWPAIAATDPVIVSVLDGSKHQIKVDSSRETIDPIFYSADSAHINNPAKDRYRNSIALVLNEDDSTFISANFTVTVYVTITWTDMNGVSRGPILDTLEVDYKIAAGTKYTPRNYIYFDNARKVKVEIDSIDIHGAAWDPTTVLLLENRMEVTRDYKFLCSTTATGVDHELGDVNSEGKFDELVVSWTPQAFKGITNYDVEWSWVDIDALERYKTGGNFDAGLLFRNNSSRVTIQGQYNSFNVPLIYDGDGYLFYRVRPVQYTIDGQIIEGTWSATGTSGITYYVYDNGHEPDYNWQVSTTYAEDGKHKTVVQYFDGTLRSRQTVTKDNVNHTTVVAETFYDYQGRPAINILPSPTINTVISYVQNFNRFTTGGTDPKALYDLVPNGQTICNTNTPVLDNNHGASKYYSPNNPDVNNGINKYIPDAEGYPYAETRYTPDATGRIASQGGVGTAFQLSSGHETKYFYGYADQRELDALFGTEVGHFSHYFKNMIRDANGQYSVSYVDMHGRTIATALAGNPPPNLKALDSFPTIAPYITKNLLGNNLVKDRSIQSATTLLVPRAGTHDFHYDLGPQSAEIIACNPEGQSVCYNCYYDLEIRITGTCGETPIIINRRNFSFGNYATNCDTTNLRLRVDTSVYLAEGEYNISKTLSLSKHAQDWYRDSVFVNKNICKTLQQFYEEIYDAMLDSSNCSMTCEGCEAGLGTREEYRTRFLQGLGIDPNTTVAFEKEIETSYDQAYQICQELCGEAETKLKSIRELMLQDMTPDQGQYAKLNKDLNGDGEIFPGTVIFYPSDTDRQYQEWEVNDDRPYNIFRNIGDDLHPLLPYQHPKDRDGNDYYYQNFAGLPDASIAPLLATITPYDFSDQFDTSWAKALLPYHPEYAKLKLAEDQLSESYKWDAKLEAIDTWTAVLAGNFDTDILELDPFFNGVGSGKKGTMTTFVTSNYKKGKSMWQIAIMAVHCRNSPNPACLNTYGASPPYVFEVCESDWNYVWRLFRTMYLSEKDRLVSEYIDANTPVVAYDVLQSQRYQRRFGNLRQLSSNLDILIDELEAIGDSQDTEHGIQPIYGPQEAQLFTETCAGYIDLWKSKLLECDSLSNHPQKDVIIAAIVAGMKDVCFRGSDVDHPYGSSTVKPTDNGQPRSFEEVIASVFNTYNIPVTSRCNPWIIDYPEPYDHQTPISDDVINEPQDKCVCKRLEDLKAEKLATNYNGTLSQFIQYQHGIFIRQTFLDTLLNGCNGNTGCTTYDPPLAIPAILDCNTPIKNCIDCAEYTKLKSQFKSMSGYTTFNVIYEADSLTDEQNDRNLLFEKFMNQRSGLHKSWLEYLQFEKACATFTIVWNCKKLDSIVTVFYTSHPTIGWGDSCRTVFTTFFNSAFSLSPAYTFAQIQSLFVQYCGHLPDVCQPVLDCKSFENIIKNFYQYYGASIATAFNCQTLFTNYFNSYYGTAYTWSDITHMYEKLCGYELNVCTAFSCTRLQQILDMWFGCNNTAWLDSNCLSQWVAFFNSKMGTSLEAWEIEELYKRCNIPLHPCLPPIDIATLQNLANAYHNTGSNACPSLVDPTCEQCYANFVNETLGRSYSYEQIALMYKKATGTDLAVCALRYSIKALTEFSTGYISANYDKKANCDSLFTHAFNTEFNTAYNFEQIMAVYELYCGQQPDVCGKEKLLTCTQIETVHKQFMLLYPDPVGYFTINGYKQAFQNFFNQSVGDTLDYNDIYIYYGTLCGIELNFIDTSKCTQLGKFLTDYNTKYAAYSMPQALCRDLFTHLFNKTFAAKAPHSWTDIKKMYDSCSIALTICPADSSQLLACTRLEGTRLALVALYDGRTPDDCSKLFTDLFNHYFETPFTSYEQLTDWAKDNCGVAYNLCGSAPETASIVLRTAVSYPPMILQPRLCSTLTMFPTVTDDEGDPCDFLQTLALNAATEQYNYYVQHQLDNFDSTYRNKCLSVAGNEVFTVRSQVAEYHYTLFYYNQAGSLVKTVPPAGVHPDFSDGFYNSVEAAKASGSPVLPPHTFKTQYRYNTLGQVVAQNSPDGGTSHFWYDVLGRLVVSQNAKQATGTAKRYSYTKYDILGRITEVGQLISSTAITQAIAQDAEDLDGWITAVAGSREQITNTVYDEAESTLCGPPSILCQKNLRNRVSYTTMTDFAADLDYASAIYYTYDIHGNVDTLLQHYKKGIMSSVAGNAFKRIVYKYDLSSGNINEVAYQPGIKDQFYHRYKYDAENKVTEAWTSHDYVYWERQVHYGYYKHGPVARMEIGQLGVQGMDYVYTLHGWLKGVNTTAITLSAGDPTVSFDPGGDGKRGTRVARDGYGFSLNYYSNYEYPGTVYHEEYKSINSGVTPFSSVGNGLPPLADGVMPGKDLFNGNIKAMIMNIPKLGDALLYGYHYDQVNRITAMNSYSGLNVSTNVFTPTNSENYKERLSYDNNGNILRYLRNGSTVGGGAQAMDSMNYNYYNNSNKLSHVDDAVNGSNYLTDIDDQNLNNYTYDEIGNLTGNTADSISSVEWTVYGKVSKITKIDGTLIFYTYDASYNLIGKRVHRSDLGITSTWYVRDASGNVMAIYENNNPTVNNGKLSQVEVHIYGSNRIGLWHANRDVQSTDWALFDAIAMPGTSEGGHTETLQRGSIGYELSNHLGNVMVTVSDRKIQVQSPINPLETDYYTADNLTANDYYPFGSLMPGRKFNAGLYRYGFNGKEKDFDINNEGNTLDFGARIYDSRIGRWLSVDRLSKPYLTPYHYTGNNPVNFLDPSGNDEFHFYFRTVATYYKCPSCTSYVRTAKTVAWVVVVKNSNPDQFYHHKQNQTFHKEGYAAAGQFANTISGGQITEKTTEFFPFTSSGRVDFEKKAVPFTAGLWQWGLHHFEVLLKYENMFTGLSDYANSRTDHLSSFNQDNWKYVPLKSKIYKIGNKVIGGLEIAADIIMIGGGLLELAAPASAFMVRSVVSGEILPMKIERIIAKGEKIDNIIQEGKALTYSTGNEHGVVTLANGQRALVSGGPGGIHFETGQIKTLFGHSHPYGPPSTPSSDDFKALGKLGQSKQWVFINGEIQQIRNSAIK